MDFDDDSKQQDLDTLDLVEELAINAENALDEEKNKISLEPGNASLRIGQPIPGTTVQLTRTSLSALFSTPIGVGDVYRIRWETPRLETCYLFCRKCRVLQNDSFEAEFDFFTPRDIN